ncbi:MAG: hypothetical protein KJ630_19070 [Proteobacteria bacterium]|nr:hypothetical protein [Pseudomonadota bacterium]
MRDLHNNIDVRAAISPQDTTDNTALVSEIIDCAGYDGMEFAISAGTLTDANATFTVLVHEDSDSALATASAVADAQLLGTEALASFTFAGDDDVTKIGYIGNERYVRLTVTPAGNSASALISAVAIMGYPKLMPVT